MNTLEQSTRETAAALRDMIDKAGRESLATLSHKPLDVAEFRLDKHYKAGTITLAQYRRLDEKVFGLHCLVTMEIDDEQGFQPMTV